MTDTTDEQLCLAAAGGNEQARSDLVMRYASLVGIRASSYVNRSDGFERDDLIQEGFIGLLSAITDYNASAGASFKTFALLCIDRKIADAVKRGLRKKQIPQSAKVDIDDVEIGTPSAESEVIAADRLRRIITLIEQKASEKEKQIFRMYISGSGYAEIAARLGCSRKSVENALARVRRKLADL